jgi:hypothetical protein
MDDDKKKTEAPKTRGTSKSEARRKEIQREEEVASSGVGVPKTEEAPQGETPTGAEPKGEQVVVSKDDLAAFMRRLDTLEMDNKRLLEAADKSRMAAISERERMSRTGLPRVKLTRMGGPTGKLVVAWRMTRNESYMQGRIVVEHQEMEVFYEDGTSERMPLLDFYRKQNKDTIAEIISRTKNEGDNGEMLKLRLVSDGTEREVELKFVN